jgi:hypothetical protein
VSTAEHSGELGRFDFAVDAEELVGGPSTQFFADGVVVLDAAYDGLEVVVASATFAMLSTRTTSCLGSRDTGAPAPERRTAATLPPSLMQVHEVPLACLVAAD